MHEQNEEKSFIQSERKKNSKNIASGRVVSISMKVLNRLGMQGKITTNGRNQKLFSDLKNLRPSFT